MFDENNKGRNVKVVTIKKDQNGVTIGLFRDILTPDQYHINEYQIILPDGYYSSGFYERTSFQYWDDLPWLNTPK